MKSRSLNSDNLVLGELAKFAVGSNTSDETILSLMILFHTHRFIFARPILPSRPHVSDLAALTQHHVADVASIAFPTRNSTELYWIFNSFPGSLECMEDLPSELASQVASLRNKLLTHPDVISVTPED